MRLLFLLFVVCATTLHAQYDDLLRKNRYTWVAEYTCDYELNPIYSEKMYVEMNFVHLIRLENTKGRNDLTSEFEIPFYLGKAMLQGPASGKSICFSDSSLTRQLLYSQIDSLLVRNDTIFYYHGDRSDGTEGTKVIKTETSPNEIDIFRVRQVFFYDARKQIFGARLLAVAPVVNVYDLEGNSLGRQPLLWIKISDQDANASQKQIKSSNYIVQTFMYGNAPEPEAMKTVKGELDLKKWATTEVRNPSHQVLAYEDFATLDVDALHGKIFTTDTLIVYDPETYEESATIVRDNAIDRVEKIRFVQNWYYDERKHRLAMHVVAVAPLAAVRDSEGNLRYYKPLFYSKY